jgi:23S rRNA (uracil1939-C5)-methyltransferase
MSDVIECTIESLAYGVLGVARTDHGVLMIPDVVPGDVVRARIVAERRGHCEAEVVEILHPSGKRRFPPCRWVSECGGCPWQQVAYPTQLAAKEAAVRDALVRIGRFSADALDIRPIVPSSEWNYRHRVTLRVDGEQRLGFYRHRSHRLVEIGECLIADDTVNRHLPAAREWLRGVSTTVRRVVIADAGDGEGVFVANAEGTFRHDGEYHDRFLRVHPTVRGIILFGGGWRKTFGEPRVEVGVDGFLLESHGGFTQVNPAGNRELVAVLTEMAAVRADDTAIDLYCGAGNLTLPLARRAASVTGVELDPWTLGDARRNADRAGLRNCRFIQQAAGPAARSLAGGGERFSLVVLDPPRSGAAEVLEHLPRLHPERILYVSCNPATLARDLRHLVTLGFRLGPIRPIDLFPQTYHVETVVRLDRVADPA